MISVNSLQHGLRIVPSLSFIYEKYQLVIANGVVSVTPDRPFQLLVENMDKKPQRLAKHQDIKTVIPHPLAIFPTWIIAA